jgi:hypothetical protein
VFANLRQVNAIKFDYAAGRIPLPQRNDLCNHLQRSE